MDPVQFWSLLTAMVAGSCAVITVFWRMVNTVTRSQLDHLLARIDASAAETRAAVTQQINERIDHVSAELRTTRADVVATQSDLKALRVEFTHRFDHLNESLGDRVDQVDKSLSTRIEDVAHALSSTRTELSERIDHVNDSLGSRIDQVNESLGNRIDQVNESLGNRIDQVNESLGNRIDTSHTELSHRMLVADDSLGQRIDRLAHEQATTRAELAQHAESLKSSIEHTALITAQRDEKLQDEVARVEALITDQIGA